jgi:histidinol phosphatase-like enzyme (inositol monophosphatase family)
VRELTAKPSLAHLEAIAQGAAAAAMGFWRGRLGVEFKADESPVTQADRAVEAEVRRLIAAQFPGDGIYGEEGGRSVGETGALWVIDPIDGTRSFLSGHPMFGFLLTYLAGGQPRLSAVGLPALAEIYLAERGKGAFCRGERLRTSGQTKLSDTILYLQEAEKVWRGHPDLFARLMSTGSTRRMAYDAGAYTLLARGHVDLVIDYDLQPYDYLAVSLLVEEAGGVMTDWRGGRLSMGEGIATVAAATPELHAAALALIHGA